MYMQLSIFPEAEQLDDKDFFELSKAYIGTYGSMENSPYMVDATTRTQHEHSIFSNHHKGRLSAQLTFQLFQRT